MQGFAQIGFETGAIEIDSLSAQPFVEVLHQARAVGYREMRGEEAVARLQRADPFVGRALSHIWNHSHRVMTVEELADMMAISRRTLERRFRKALGRSVLQGITVVGSIVGTRVDLAETFQLHAEGRTKVVRETRQLEQVNESFEQIEKGEIDARLVFDFRH